MTVIICTYIKAILSRKSREIGIDDEAVKRCHSVIVIDLFGRVGHNMLLLILGES